MRLIKIETRSGDVIINTSQICRIFKQGDLVVMSMGDDVRMETLFTDVEHAVDYVQRAPSCSFGE